jgi:Rv2525c-like, glycoside hydrolase-like domain
MCVALCALVACADDEPTITEATSEVTIRVERGVDRASAFSPHEARILARDHGVKWTGVYIGGACSAGSGWTKAAINNIYDATKWRFMPIWVGQQSPAICGAHTLSYARGKLDGMAAAHRMAQLGWKGHRDIPIALDVEAGTYEHSHSGSTSYVHGWVAAVHAAGYRAYVYSSPTGIVHFRDAKIRVDGGWVASFFFSGFRKVQPSDLHQIGRRFIHHNRAWQYAGNFFVSGVGRVDADTSDLLLAPRPGGTNRVRTSQPMAPLACGELSPGEGLYRGESIASCDGTSVLALDEDGELTLTVRGVVTWSAEAAGAGETAVLGTDGELVVYDADQEPVFATGTPGHPDATLSIGDDLALVDDGAPVWTAAGGAVDVDAVELDDQSP